MKFKWRRARGINWFYTWVYNPIAGIKEDIETWLWWRGRCGACAGDGDIELGDYGESYREVCTVCNGTGKKPKNYGK